MTPEEALRNILSLVDGSDEVEDVHALQILLQSIKTLAEKGVGTLGMTFRSFTFRLDCSSRRHAFAPRQRSQIISPGRIIDGDTLEIHGTRIRTLKMYAYRGRPEVVGAWSK
jgi:hypothetical protein